MLISRKFNEKNLEKFIGFCSNVKNILKIIRIFEQYLRKILKILVNFSKINI